MSSVEFGNRKGEEHENTNKWERVNWESWSAWARQVEDNLWDVSIELPKDADPDSIRIGFITSEYRNGEFYTVQYKLKGLGVYRLLEIDAASEEDNQINNFGVHIGGDLERSLNINEYNPASINKPRDL